MSKKEQMLNIALNLFTKEGYDNVGIQKIVTQVGVTKPTLYHYFGSKEGLLEEVLKTNYGTFFIDMNQKSEYNGDIVLTLENLVFHFMNFAKNNKEFYRLIMNLSYAPEESLVHKCMIKYLIMQHQIIENVFKNAEKQHGNMIGRSTMYSFTFLGMINSAISYYFFTKDKEDINEEAGRKLCRQFMYGIFS